MDDTSLPSLPSGFQLDEAAPAPPSGFQLDSAPSAPPAQAPAPSTMPKVAPADIASTLGHNPLAGVYTPPGGTPDTTVAGQSPQGAPQQAPAATQPTPAPPPAAPQGAAGAQPPGQPPQAPSPLGQAEQSGHDAKVQQALTPPNLQESAIPPPVAPNPQPPPVAPALSQAQADQDQGVNPNGLGTANPPKLDLPAGATLGADGVVHSSTAPHWLDVLMGASQKAGNAVVATGAGLSKDLHNPGTAARTGVGLGYGLVGKWGANVIKAAGQGLAGLSRLLPDLGSRKQAMEVALSNGDMEAYKNFAAQSDEEYRAHYEQLAKALPPLAAFDIERKGGQEAGKATVEYGAQSQRLTGEWAKQHGVDPEKLAAFGDNASLAGIASEVGEQAPLLAVSGGASGVGTKTAVRAMEVIDPKLMQAASRGAPAALDAVKRVTTLSATVTSISFQTAYISGVSGAEASERVKKMSFDELRQSSPEFMDAVTHGADAEVVRDDLAMRAGYRAQAAAIVAMSAASVAGPIAGGLAHKTGPKVASISEGAANNAVLQGSLQASSNYGVQVANPQQSISQGVIGQAAGGAVIGGLLGSLGGGHEAPIGRTKEQVAADTAAIKRGELKAQAEAGLDKNIPTKEAIYSKADQAKEARESGKLFHAGKAVGVTVTAPTAVKPAAAPTVDAGKEAAKDALKSYLAAPDNNDKLGPVANRLLKVSALDRWSQLDGGRSPDEYTAAMKRLSATGKLPPEIEERIGSDFNEDGTLTDAALHNDVRLNPAASILHARLSPDQLAPVVEQLRGAGVNPYVTAHGDVAVLGDQATLSAMQEHLAAQHDGANFTVTENHYGQALDQDAGAAEGQGQPSEAENPEGPEGGTEGAARDGDGTDQAAQVVTARSQPVIDRLEEAGVTAPVAGDGRVTVAAGNEGAVDAAAHDAAESQLNDRREPTPAQKREGNYPKGKLLFASDKGDIPVNIENPAGSVRKSLPGEKPSWSRKMTEHYGYIPGTYSADGQPVDVLVGRKSHDDSLPVFVMQQTKPDGSFDEHKVVMGARSEREARDMYLKQYPAAMHDSLLQGQTKMVRFSRPQFADWLKTGDHDVPIHPMSKQPMLKLREPSGRLDVHYRAGTTSDSLDTVSEAINKKFGTSLHTVADGAGYRLTGSAPKAKVPAIHRSLQRTEGHEQTQYDGNPAGELYAGAGEGGGGRVPEGRGLGPAAEPAAKQRGARVPRSREPASQEGPQSPSPRWLNRPSSDAPIYSGAKRGAHPVSMVGVHYSGKGDLSELDSSFAGSGSAGAERKRYGLGAPAQQADHRLFFYARQSRDLPTKEPAVSGQHAYESQLDNLYDVRQDPDGIIDRAEAAGKAGDKDAILNAIRRAGYDGVVMPGVANDTPVAMLIGRQKVPVKAVQGERYIFGGMKATAPKDFSKIGRLVNAGKSGEEIHAETGWHKGSDGKWRFEIDDSQAKLLPREQWEAKAQEGAIPIEQVFQHDELYKQYPALKDYKLKVDPNYPRGNAVNDLDNKVITIADPDGYGGFAPNGKPVPILKSVLAHELQHAVQEEEGFARGGSPEEFAMHLKNKVERMKGRINDLEARTVHAIEQGEPEEIAMERYSKEFDQLMEAAKKGGYYSSDMLRKRSVDQYERLAGEVEARNVMKRLHLSPEARALSHPESTQDRPNSEHIVAESNQWAPLQESRQHAVETELWDRLGLAPGGAVGDRAKYDASVKAYRAIPDTKGGKIISADIARELSPHYVADRTQSVATHEPVSAFVKQYYKELLAKPHDEDATVLFTAGGTGAGKTTALDKTLGAAQAHAEMIYDTNMNKLASSIKKIDQALATGRKVHIAYVYRDPVEAFTNGALKRAERQRGEFGTGRTVPVSIHAETHVGALETMRALAKHYDGNRRVKLTTIDNSGGPNTAHAIPLDKLDSLSYTHGELTDQLHAKLEEQRSQGKISEETYRGFLQVPSDDAGRAGGVREADRAPGRGAAQGGAGAREVRPAVRGGPERGRAQGRADEVTPPTGEALTKHVSTLQAHVDALKEDWKAAPEVAVVRSARELPEPVAKRLETSLGPDSTAEGVYYGGKVYLVGDAIHDKAHAEYVVAHEMMGHYGLRHTFGAGLDNLLSEIHAAIHDNPEFKDLSTRYADAYSGLGLRERELAITEEYLSNRAMLADNRPVLAKVVGWVRKWARSAGLVSRWTDNDVLSLMDGVSQNVRDGKVSRNGWTPQVTTFNDEQGRAVTTYEGAAGEGTVTSRRDGSRDLALGDLKASVSRVMTDAGTGMLVSKLQYKDPSDLLRITRLAGEEAKGYVLFPSSAEAGLKEAGIPTERVGDYLQTPASRVGEQPARFSLRNQPDDPALRDRINRVLQVPESSMTPWDRFQHWGRQLLHHDTLHQWTQRFIQQNVDRLVPIANASMQMHGGTLLDAAEDAYKMANLSQNTREVLGAVMKLGVPEYKNGSFEPVAGHKGLMEILTPLYHQPVKGFDRMWEFYAMARRGDQLSRQVNPDGTSKEKLLTAEDIKEGLALGQKYPLMAKVFDEWQTFNQQLLDLAVERGNMTKEMADLWKQNDYVPFYRVAGDEDLAPLGRMPGGMRVSSKRLTGSERQVEPIIENIINNTGSVLRKVYRNEALRRAAALGENVGAVERVPTQFRPIKMSVGEIEQNLEKLGLFVGQQANAQRSAKLQITPAQAEQWTRFFRAQEPLGADTFSVMENGKPVYYKGLDPDYLQAVNSISKQQQLEKWFTKVFGAPKNFLTHAITLNPAFMMRHLERQVTHTWVQSGENFNPFSHAIANAKDAYTNSEFMQKLTLAGAGGNEYYDVDQLREEMRALGTHSTVLDTGHKVWMAYRKIGFVADQMNRMGIAKSVLERGGSTAEAAWQAQDLLNFRMHGDSNLMRHLIAAVPFLNARIQGMYRIARGAQGIDQSYKARSRAVIAFLIKSATLIAASQMLALKNNGDPRYEKLPDEAKDLYWHIFIGNHHFAIAKPFELGAIFSTLPDRAVRFAEGLDGSRTFRQSLARVFETVFRLDPTPALVNPALQDWRNKDELTQRPIVPENLQGVDPTLQANPYTSPTLKAVAQHMPEFAPNALRSPLRLEHLVDGYVGSLGLYALDAADAAMRATHNAPAAPSGHLLGGPLVNAAFGSMVGPVDTDPRNRYESQLFEDKQALDEIAKSVKKYQKLNDVDGLNRYYMKNRTALQYKGDILAGYRQMEDLRKQEQAIYSNTTMTPGQKREALDKITKVKNAYLDKLAPILNLADSAL